jgi:CHAD domain-containing protein
MNRQIGKLSKSVETAHVHKFRTQSRRVETLISEFGPGNGNQQKLLKLLSKLRKKAGKVRDLDVQIAFLKDLKVPDRQDHKPQLLESLEEEQSRRSKKLEKSVDSETVRQLRKRLKRVKAEMQLDGTDPLALAHKRLPSTGPAPLNENSLHACRIQAKRARYLAELAPKSEESKLFIKELKRAQDAIGEWHDMLKLKEAAERQFGGVHDSALVAALQNLSRARYRVASGALFSALAAVSKVSESSEHAGRRKPPATVQEQRAAVA